MIPDESPLLFPTRGGAFLLGGDAGGGGAALVDAGGTAIGGALGTAPAGLDEGSWATLSVAGLAEAAFAREGCSGEDCGRRASSLPAAGM